jgi:glycosyltransferase involved in cell wall biosynthesis
MFDKGHYYFLKLFIPRWLQIVIRRALIHKQLPLMKDVWPIDQTASKRPEGWKEWPDGKRFALVLTHDVETEAGLDKCHLLMDVEERLDFRSSFGFVAKDYKVPHQLLKSIKNRGFEVHLHGLYHKKNPFRSKKAFDKQYNEINRYLNEWNAVGFRSPSMYHDFNLVSDLNIKYDASTFDTDPFEPQPDGITTIFPFWVPHRDDQRGYVELPYTLPQDFLLFILMEENNVDIWKRKLDWIAKNGGMALLITHPDYMNFKNTELRNKEYPVQYYEEFLDYISTKYKNQYWHALPCEIAHFWKEHFPHKTKRIRPKLRVCMLTYSFYETDARVRKYAETLARQGDHVDVLSLKREGQHAHDFLDGVNIYRIQERSVDEKGKFDYLYKLIKFLINSTFQLTKKHIMSRYDIIHVHSVPDFEVLAAILPKVCGTKIILDIHDPVPDFFSAKFGIHKGKHSIYIKALNLIEYISANFADQVITVTDYWKEKIAKRSGIADEKIAVIMNLPDTRIFNFKNATKEHKSKTDFTLLYPGTLNKHCGLDIAIRAVNLVRDEIPSMKFLIYGTGSELNNLKSLVKELNLENIVSFHNSVPLTSIPEIMHKADVGIALLSGYDEYSQQALNVKLFEFLSLGLPAIATRTKSVEYYLDNRALLLSEPNDPTDVARCIKEIYGNAGKRNELINKGLEFIKKHNSETEMIKYLRIIDKLCI